MGYVSHIQWHPEDASYKCAGCGASERPLGEIAILHFVRDHQACWTALSEENSAAIRAEAQLVRAEK